MPGKIYSNLIKHGCKTVCGVWMLLYAAGTFCQQPVLMLPSGHSGVVNYASFSPDGKWVVTAADDNTAKIWDAVTGQLIIELKVPNDYVDYAAFSPDGKRVLTVLNGGTLKIWDSRNGQLLINLTGHKDWINSTSFSPDGKWIATASYDHTAKIWNAATGRLVFDLTQHTAGVNSACFSPDSKWLVTTSDDSTTIVWNVLTGKVKTTCKDLIASPEQANHLKQIRITTFSDDGKYAVTVAGDHSAKVWHVATRRFIADLNGHSASINSAGFSPDGKWIVTTSDDKTANVWNTVSGKLKCTLRGHSERVNAASFSPDNTKLVTVSDDKTAKVWNNTDGRLLSTFTGHTGKVNHASFSSGGDRIVTVSDDSTALVWMTESGRIVSRCTGHNGRVTNSLFSPRRGLVVTVSDDNTARVWDPKTGTLLADMKATSGKITGCQFAKDERYLIATYEHEQAGLLNIDSGFASNGWTNVKIPTATELFLKVKSIDRINSASFSPDGKWIVTASNDGVARVWNAGTGEPVTELRARDSKSGWPNERSASENKMMLYWSKSMENLIASDIMIDFFKPEARLQTARFSPDGKWVATTDERYNARVWNAFTGDLVSVLHGHEDEITALSFSPDGKFVYTAAQDFTVTKWDPKTGNPLDEWTAHDNAVNSLEFSPDGKKIVTASRDKTAIVWDAASGKILVRLNGHTSSPVDISFLPGKKLFATSSDDSTAKVWNTATGQLVMNLKGHAAAVRCISFSPDGKWILTGSDDRTAKIWNTATGELKADLAENDGPVRIATFSSDGGRILVVTRTGYAKIWNAESGQLISELKLRKEEFTDVIMAGSFSLDGKKVLTYFGKTARMWDANTGEQLFETGEHMADITDACFSPDGQSFVTIAYDKAGKVWSAADGRLLFELKQHTGGHDLNVINGIVLFSPDGKWIIAAATDSTAKLWDASTGALRSSFAGHASDISAIFFNTDGKQVLVASGDDGTARIWDIASGSLIKTIQVKKDEEIYKISFEDSLLVSFHNSEMNFYSTVSGKKLYTLLAVDSTGYLVFDADGHYDGTENARKLMYFVCGREVIGLDQVKDSLWIPHLAERLLKREMINASTLSGLDICDVTPEVETIEENELQYRFRIRPRRGGIGETVLYINNIEVRRYTTQQLIKKGDGFELLVRKKDFDSLMVSGEKNSFSLKSWTRSNTISSRGGIVVNTDDKKIIRPNLYAVMVGISDYKGEDMDLKYADKDADDLSAAVAAASRKLLNTGDGVEHVFMYNVNTGNNRKYFPEKRTIQQVLAEIGKKCTANDVLLVFFAGHGVMDNAGRKQFYFLTADASRNSDYAITGISTTELAEWLKPPKIKAQKRILILDACNSGKAIDELVVINARNDDASAQIKAIDKLGERSGFFILSASAASQNAYEMSNYNQGVLTHALLKVIKQRPDILEEGRYLNISNWFVAAEKTVADEVSESGSRQNPQISSNGNINIGIVDDEVRAGIKLADASVQFSVSNFQNSDENIIADNLRIGKLVDNQLNAHKATKQGDLVFTTGSASPEAISITGRYSVQNNTIDLRVVVRKNNTTLFSIPVSGTIPELNTLAQSIVEKTIEWIKSNTK